MDYTTLASDETINATIASMKERNFSALVVNTKEEALAKIKELVPAGVSVMNGSSTTLEQIGYVEYLKSGAHPWKNLHADIVAEKDPEKQRALRRQALTSEYYLGSAHAVAQTGEMFIASNSGSQLPHVTFSSPNLILVVSTKKIAPSFEDARKRLIEHVVALEDARMKRVNGPESGTKLNKLFIFFGEPVYTGRKVTVLFVKEDLGF